MTAQETALAAAWLLWLLSSLSSGILQTPVTYFFPSLIVLIPHDLAQYLAALGS